MNTLLVLLLPLVAKTPDPADVKPGWLGFGVFIALLVAVVLLWLSMRRHLKKVDFEEQADSGERSAAPREAQDH
jgi:high-affinity Fe2+/Pb2+ permease